MKTIASPMRIYALQGYKLTDSNRKIMSKFFIKFVDEDKPYIDENANNKEYKNYSIFDAYIRPLGL